METEEVMGDVEECNEQEQNRVERLAELAIGASAIKKYTQCIHDKSESGSEKLTIPIVQDERCRIPYGDVGDEKTKKQLLAVKGMSEPEIDKVRDAAMRLCGFGFTSGVAALQRREQAMKITTVLHSVMRYLVVALRRRRSLNFVVRFTWFTICTGACLFANKLSTGEFRYQKTQLPHTLCMTAQLSRGDGVHRHGEHVPP